MPETLALARLAISRHRMAMFILVAWTVIGLAVSTIVSMIFHDLSSLPLMVISMLPVAAWSLGLFDVGSGQDLMDGESGYSHWLLRMPIADWKLALVPIALRTLWICVFWCLFASTARQLSGVRLPIWSMAAVLSAMGVWVSVITWRPFANGWWRLAAMLVTGISLYGLLILLMMTHFDSQVREHWIPAVKFLISIGGYVAFAVGLACALRAVALARTSSAGLIPEIASRGLGGAAKRQRGTERANAIIRDYRNPRTALVGHDLIRLSLTHRRWTLIYPALFILFVMLFLPFSGETVVFVVLISGYMSFATALGLLEEPKRNKSSLPNYLAASPLTCAEIGFTRAITMVTLSVLGLLVVAMIFAGWAAWPENRATFVRWVGQMAGQYGSPMAAYRIVAAVGIASVVLIPTRCIFHSAAAMTGSPRIQLAAMAGPMLLILGCVALATGWMLRQTDWESATANAWYWASWLPTLGAAALVIKAVLVSIAVRLTRRHQLLTARTTNSILAAWIVVTLLLSLIMFWLIPDPRVLFWWCLLATALALPLAHVLILPYAIFINRHR